MILLTPGPVQLPDAVRLAMAQQPLHHRSEEFFALTEHLWNGLRYAFATTQSVALLAGSGMTGIEAAMCNTISDADEILVVVHGRFGSRLAEIGRLYGFPVTVLEVAWGHDVSSERITVALEANPRITTLWLVHSETSTGVALDVKGIAESVRTIRPDLLICVDAVSSVGVQPVLSDAWGLDIVAAGSQKGLMAPPGLAAVMVSSRARQRMAVTPRRSYTMDLPRVLAAMEENRFVWTPPVTLVAALTAALDLLKQETLESRWKSRETLAHELKSGLTNLGFDLFGISNAVGLTVVRSKYAQQIRQRLASEFGLIVAGGQGMLKENAIRVGTMGDIGHATIVQLLQAWSTIQKSLRS